VITKVFAAAICPREGEPHRASSAARRA
jgi:hypothetical protein